MEERTEIAIAKLITNLCHAANFFPDVAIELLKAQKAVPEDYTFDNFLLGYWKWNEWKFRKGRY